MINSLLLISALMLGMIQVSSLVAELQLPVVDHGSTELKLASVMNCRNEMSPLLRLECYDRLLDPERALPVVDNNTQIGPVWQVAMGHEKGRSGHSTEFLVTVGEGDNPTVLLTTRAIGVSPPRPVLMLSCIDNITRMQIALINPSKQRQVNLTTDKTQFTAQWFLRENGYLLESSRGLAGIEEIKQLIGGDRLTVTDNAQLKLVFNIAQLEQAIKPLRTACHW